jgi:hypothetical protein
MGIETRNPARTDALYSAWLYGENKKNLENYRRGLIERWRVIALHKRAAPDLSIKGRS